MSKVWVVVCVCWFVCVCVCVCLYVCMCMCVYACAWEKTKGIPRELISDSTQLLQSESPLLQLSLSESLSIPMVRCHFYHCCHIVWQRFTHNSLTSWSPEWSFITFSKSFELHLHHSLWMRNYHIKQSTINGHRPYIIWLTTPSTRPVS